ncbi:MAG: hypothetical protein ACJAUH_001848 [Saprospiraceae bacterium]|jgi:hypothetical protein
MKNLIFTLSIITLAAFTSQAKSVFAPLDTVKEKKSAAYIFETEIINLSSHVEEEYLEESSKKTVANLRPLPSDFSGYKVEIARVYHKPLGETSSILSKYEKVMIERVGENTYTYLTGEFNSKKAAKAFIHNLASNNSVKLVQYKNGLRVN